MYLLTCQSTDDGGDNLLVVSIHLNDDCPTSCPGSDPSFFSSRPSDSVMTPSRSSAHNTMGTLETTALSCATVRRSASSAATRAVTSRPTPVAPTMLPPISRIGDSDNEM